ncbi:MAG: hypothetical protein WC755_06970 [Candidatus Woesearchaeota archaeon]|jgi:hypothetical protein
MKEDLFSEIVEYFTENNRLHHLVPYDTIAKQITPISISLNRDGNICSIPCEFNSTNTELQKLLRKVSTSLYGIHLQPSDNITITDVEIYNNAKTQPISITYRINNLEKRIFIKTYSKARIFGLELENLYADQSYQFIFNDKSIVENAIDGNSLLEFSKDELNKMLEEKSFVDALIRHDLKTKLLFLGDNHRGNNLVIRNEFRTKKEQNHTYFLRSIDFDSLFMIENLEQCKYRNYCQSPHRILTDEELTDKTIYTKINELSKRDVEEIVEDEKTRIKQELEKKKERFEKLTEIISMSFNCENNDQTKLKKFQSLLKYIQNRIPNLNVSKCKNYAQLLKEYVYFELDI